LAAVISFQKEREREQMARLMRWATDAGGWWQLDMESPVTMEGRAIPVPLGPPSLLGLSRGPRITRTKQLDFIHRFMSSPLVPSFCAANGSFFMHHAHLMHLTEKLYANLIVLLILLFFLLENFKIEPTLQVRSKDY
jgi:hypothetical protein